MKAPSSRPRMTQDDRDRIIELARQRDTQAILASLAESKRLAALVRPEYLELRNSILRVVGRGASPQQIAALLAKVQPEFREIDAEEIYGLEERCPGCWREKSDCDEIPCRLDAQGVAIAKAS